MQSPNKHIDGFEVDYRYWPDLTLLSHQPVNTSVSGDESEASPGIHIDAITGYNSIINKYSNRNKFTLSSYVDFRAVPVRSVVYWVFMCVTYPVVRKVRFCLIVFDI